MCCESLGRDIDVTPAPERIIKENTLEERQKATSDLLSRMAKSRNAELIWP